MMQCYKGVVISLLLTHSLSYCLFKSLDYDFAIHAAQKGDWEKAQKLLNPLLADYYNNADMLYDSGVIAYQNNDFKRACSYFSDAAELEKSSEVLREKAYFNAGNTLVVLEELEAAIEKYEKTLSINPNNAFAQHNLNKVKEMIKQKQETKEKEQQEKQDTQESKEENQDGKPNQQDNNEEEKSSDDQQQQENNKSTDEKQEQEDEQKKSSQNNQSANNESQSRNNKNKQSKEAERSTNSDNREHKRSQQDRNNQGDGTNNKDQRYSDNKTNDSFKDQQHSEQHNKIENHNFTSTQQSTSTPSSDIPFQDNHQEQKKQDITASHLEGSNTIKKNKAKSTNLKNPLIAAILEKQEEKDKQINKKIMEVKIQSGCMDNDGKNCW